MKAEMTPSKNESACGDTNIRITNPISEICNSDISWVYLLFDGLITKRHSVCPLFVTQNDLPLPYAS